MNTTIVCGLLGAGKTTFIQHLVTRSSGKTVVLVNDFGKAGIDGEIFSSGGIESVELPNGCVGGRLRFDLITTIQKIMEKFSPVHLVIEPSGVASPSGVIEALESLNISPVTVVGVVDATEFLDLHEMEVYGNFFEDQIANSDVILINKTDLADEERIGRTAALIEGINPGAIILCTVNAVLNEPLLVAGGPKRKTGKQFSHLHFETVSISPAACDYSGLLDLVKDMAKGIYGDVVRAKGLFQTAAGAFRIDISYGKVDVVPFSGVVSGNRLVVIGTGLKKDGLLAMGRGPKVR